ncbi:MAG: sugar transferase [Planctomycetota bacterium]
MAKRVFDVIVCAFAIFLFSPVLLLAYFGVRMTSSGPAIYCARRVGRGGEVFIMHKFRTSSRVIWRCTQRIATKLTE